MKHLMLITATMFLLFSCKKEAVDSTTNNLQQNRYFLNSIQKELSDSLSAEDYKHLNFAQVYKSKDVQSNYLFVRISFINADIANDFLLLKADSSGKIKEGKIIHVDKATSSKNAKYKKFSGTFNVCSLNRKHKKLIKVVEGKTDYSPGTMSMMKEEPVGEQELPEVVVTSYTTNGSYSGDWYWYNGFYNDYGASGGDGYLYGSSGGGGGTYSNPVSDDNVVIVEVEPDDAAPIKVEDYSKCFGTVPDANAVYRVTICSDIPVDGDPSQIFNWSTGSPGHSFIQLTKTSGSIRIQQNFGFYPATGWKSLGSYPTTSKVVDNGGHEFNASLAKTVSSSQFATTINKMESLQSADYDLITWNCTDFALSIFNASSNSPLTIPKYTTEGSGETMNTPQGLYNAIQALQSSGNSSYGSPNVPASPDHAGASHGNCND